MSCLRVGAEPSMAARGEQLWPGVHGGAPGGSLPQPPSSILEKHTVFSRSFHGNVKAASELDAVGVLLPPLLPTAHIYCHDFTFNEKPKKKKEKKKLLQPGPRRHASAALTALSASTSTKSGKMRRAAE